MGKAKALLVESSKHDIKSFETRATLETHIDKYALFGDLDFRTIDEDPNFKEDSVREVIILPILHALGYTQQNIIRSKSLHHPFIKIGSTQRPVTLIPDYCLKVQDSFAWVLDAKAPSESVVDMRHVEQVFSYATHREIRSTYFALCNGKEFALYRTQGTSDEPIFRFSIDGIEYNWERLSALLSPDSFQAGKTFSYEATNATARRVEFNYMDRPLLEEIPVKKQQARRHFGVHGYFTKQSWNVVAEYIKNFSRPGDLVLDPFGGSGITAVEALMNSRRAISIDINPLAVFVVQSLIAPVKSNELLRAYGRVRDEYVRGEPKTQREIKMALKKYQYPHGIALPKGSDVNSVEELFSDKQLAQLAFLKFLIKQEKDSNIRASLMLMFSGLVTKTNLTYHNTANRSAAGRGNAAPFAYYRYRIAPRPVDVDTMTYFALRCRSVFEAKKEMAFYINEQTVSQAIIKRGTATDLSWIPKESVDYIYTDPPYGSKIPYLDLSSMWNAWLDLKVTKSDFEMEAIVGGNYQKAKSTYNALIAQSIKEMYRVLKFDRWMSFVFAHKDPEFWHLIIETAEGCGFEYAGAVPQKNGQTSFKKRQHPFTVLSGQLIINFRKVKNPKAIMKAHLGTDITEIVLQTVEGLIAKNKGATLEQINDELIIKGLELGFLDLLKKEYSDLTPILLADFDYNPETGMFTIRKDGKFKTHLDVHLRVYYYIVSFLRRMERKKKLSTFDEIFAAIMPLLKNGTTPESQTIVRVLNDVAQHVGNDKWKLKSDGQETLFGLT